MQDKCGRQIDEKQFIFKRISPIIRVQHKVNIFDFEISTEDMEKIETVDKGVRYFTATPETIAQYAKMELQHSISSLMTEERGKRAKWKEKNWVHVLVLFC